MRDDALYAITDMREFVFGDSSPGRADAVRPLLGQGCDVRWTDRTSPGRRVAGFIVLRGPGGEWGYPDSPNAAGAVVVTDPAEAWRLLCNTDALDPAWLKDLTRRLVAPGNTIQEWNSIDHPLTVTGAVALAQAPKAMRQAEARVRELYARLEPFGGGSCPPITWRSLEWSINEPFIRSALTQLDNVLCRTVGWHPYCGFQHAAERDTRIVPSMSLTQAYAWVAKDLAGMRLFDWARSQGLTTRDDPQFRPVVDPAAVGVCLTGLDNPWESLLRIDLLGFQAQVLAPDRVVLAATDASL